MKQPATQEEMFRYLDEVFVLRIGGVPCWKVRWGTQVCSPEWEERGPALAYLSMLRKGTRKPEVSR